MLFPLLLFVDELRNQKTVLAAFPTDAALTRPPTPREAIPERVIHGTAVEITPRRCRGARSGRTSRPSSAPPGPATQFIEGGRACQMLDKASKTLFDST